MLSEEWTEESATFLCISQHECIFGNLELEDSGRHNWFGKGRSSTGACGIESRGLAWNCESGTKRELSFSQLLSSYKKRATRRITWGKMIFGNQHNLLSWRQGDYKSYLHLYIMLFRFFHIIWVSKRFSPFLAPKMSQSPHMEIQSRSDLSKEWSRFPCPQNLKNLSHLLVTWNAWSSEKEVHHHQSWRAHDYHQSRRARVWKAKQALVLAKYAIFINFHFTFSASKSPRCDMIYTLARKLLLSLTVDPC